MIDINFTFDIYNTFFFQARSLDDESLQSQVFSAARNLGYGFRFIILAFGF